LDIFYAKKLKFVHISKISMVNKKVNNRQIYYSSLNDELQQVPLLHAGTLISLLPATVKFLIQSVLGNFIHIL